MSLPKESEDEELLVFPLEVDEDKIENQSDGGWTRGIFSPRRLKSGDDTEYPSDSTIIAEVETGDSSFISVTFTTIQPLPDAKALLIILLRCHPSLGRRFTSATITWKLKASDESPSRPKVVRIAPEMALGGWTEEQIRIMKGISATAQTGAGAASANMGASLEWESSRSLQHVMALQGTIRGSGGRAHWTIEENSDLARGIPSHIHLAAVVDHIGHITMEFVVTAELGFKKWIIPLSGRTKGAQTRTIDVEKLSRGQLEFGKGPGGETLETFMTRFNGCAPEYVVHGFGNAYTQPRPN